jgi:curved DNA-binding protein CbpA
MHSFRRLSEEELKLFAGRIARNLEGRPLDLPAAAHREAVAEMVRRLGAAAGYYEILGVDPAAPVLEIHEAYERAARLVHPNHAQRLGLTGREGVLTLLFERWTEAYLSLSHPDSRKQYDRERPDWSSAPRAAVARAQEAHRLYEQARILAGAEKYHAAVELLREVVRTTPKADYLALLGLLQTKNPFWLHSAEEHLRRAIALGAQDPALPAALAEVQRRIESGDSEHDSREVEIL